MPIVPDTGKKEPVEESCATFQRAMCLPMWDSRGNGTFALQFDERKHTRPDEENRTDRQREKKARATAAPRRIQLTATPSVPKVPIHEQQRDRQFATFQASLMFPEGTPGMQFVAFFLVHQTSAIFPLAEKTPQLQRPPRN